MITTTSFTPSTLLLGILKRYRLALGHATFVVSTELDKRPFTLNHYFNENLQHARNRRKVEELRNKTRTAFTVKNGVYPQSGKQQSFSNLTIVHYNQFKDVQRMPVPRQQLGLMTGPSSDEEKAKNVEPQPQRQVAQRRPLDQVMNKGAPWFEEMVRDTRLLPTCVDYSFWLVFRDTHTFLEHDHERTRRRWGTVHN